MTFDFRDEAQVLARAKKAVPNQGLTWLAALAAKQHRYAIEYIEQAPILVLAATFGKPLRGRISKEQFAYIASRFRRIEGMKLKDAMKEFHLPYPLRKLRSTAVAAGYAEVIWSLRNVPPSALSQAIPDTVSHQQMWLRALKAVSVRAKWRGASLPDGALHWFVCALGVAVVRAPKAGRELLSNVNDLVDLFVCGRFNPVWTFEEAVTAHGVWAAEVAKRESLKSFFATYGVDLDHEVDFAPQPNELTTIDGMDVVPLRSGEALVTEGALMRHCVSTYMRDILAARSCIYSLQKDGKRVATLELSSGDRPVLKQLKGPCNARVTPDVESVAQKLIASIAARRASPIDKLKRLFQ